MSLFAAPRALLESQHRAQRLLQLCCVRLRCFLGCGSRWRRGGCKKRKYQFERTEHLGWERAGVPSHLRRRGVAGVAQHGAHMALCNHVGGVHLGRVARKK
jgi:hypothetical protein